MASGKTIEVSRWVTSGDWSNDDEKNDNNNFLTIQIWHTNVKTAESSLQRMQQRVSIVVRRFLPY